MYFPIRINWTSPFPILGLSGGIFSFLFKSSKKLLFANSVKKPDQMPHFAASDLLLHCLPITVPQKIR